MNEQELKNLLEEFKAGLPMGVSKAEVEKLISEFQASLGENVTKEQFNELSKNFNELSAKIAEESKRSVASEVKTLAGFVDTLLTDDVLKSMAQEAFEGQKTKSFDLVANKEAGPMFTSNFGSLQYLLNVEVEPGFQRAPRIAPSILPYVTKGTTNATTIAWVNMKDKDGGAAFIAEGELKPLIDWTFDEEISKAKKVAVRSTQSKEFIQDINGIRQEIVRLMREELVDKIEEKLLSGNPEENSSEPLGILTGASTYVSTALEGKVTDPTMADAIRAAMLQASILGYRPDVVFLNPGDAALLDLYKSKDGHYARIEIEGVLRSITIRESIAIPAGKFLLLDTRKWFVRFLEGITVDFGYSTGDWERNLMSIIVEARLHSYWHSIDIGAFVYGDFAAIQASLAAPEA